MSVVGGSNYQLSDIIEEIIIRQAQVRSVTGVGRWLEPGWQIFAASFS